MLLDDSGIPLFDPTVWSMTRYRQKSASTVEQALRGAMFIHLFCWQHSINLAERVRAGTFFEVGELDALVADASKPFTRLRTAAKVLPKPKFPTLKSRSTARLLRRLPTTARVRTVASETTRIRLHYATSYLKWLGERQKSRLHNREIGANEASVEAHEYGVRLIEVVEQIEERAPSISRKGLISLESGQRDRLLAVIHPESQENPWSDPFVRLRNWVIVRWLLGTGMRRGELLGLRVRDFNRGQSYCEIRRRHDDKRDTRRRQPNAKTLERLAPLDEGLTDLGERYLKARNKIKAALRHGIFFVAEDGKPLSDSAITGMFALLRERNPDVGPVSAHVLRHQWNEDFSAYADSIGLGPDEEVRERCWLMGWSPTSRMPAYYLKRRTKTKADEHSREMQRRLMKHAPKNHLQMNHIESMNKS
ncbi:site-specific integrase [Methylobacterium sp. Leaf361]|uniref:site-specific integrase n=1 Tax=Methylobacterium sp. Leaf361 TaxID=1736352 RepID=UPI000A4B5085|nr:site-specific integrase [Methylobacterium sp. Leaf361]